MASGCRGRGLATSEKFRQPTRSRRCRWTCATTSGSTEAGLPLQLANSRSVIPRREEGAASADRDVRLPLRTGRGIAVQLERRAKGHTAIGGADVIDVASVTAAPCCGIDPVNHVVEGRRLTPAPRAASRHHGSVNMQAK